MLFNRISLFYLIYTFFTGTSVSVWGSWANSNSRKRSSYCKTPDSIANAIMSRRGSILRINCQLGYILQGTRLIECIQGKWIYDEKPVCAKKGCDKQFPPVNNGFLRILRGFQAVLTCFDNSTIAGNRVAYCNGKTWDRPLGECRSQSHGGSHKHACDFESDDLCGWQAELVDNHQWKRKSPVNTLRYFNTGPQHDHTVKSQNNGHYMLMESLREDGVYVPLISPIYPRSYSLMTGCCFRFYYFMSGIGVGDLYVFVKPYSLYWENLFDSPNNYMKFNMSGHQESAWKEGFFNIPDMQEDFQIVFIANSSRSHLSDIAIDDVQLLLGDDCLKDSIYKTNAYDSTEDNEYTTTTGNTILLIT